MAAIAPAGAANWSLLARAKRVLKRPQFWFGLAVLLPTFAWYTVFLYRPIVLGLEMSVLRYNLLDPADSIFVGFRNFENVLSSDRFRIAMGNSFYYALLAYMIGLPIALLVSWCLVSVTRGRRAYQFIIFLPVVLSVVAISMLFRMLMDPQMGTLNYILRSLGLPPSKWIAGSDTALPSIVMVDVWKGLGFTVVLLSTAMLNVPQTLYDAARVDGATGWRLFRTITLPLIAPTLAMVSVLSVLGGLQVYVYVSVLGPGPGTSTLVMNQLIVNEAFMTWRFGFATAASLVLFVVILVLTLLQLRVLQPRWEY
jgi:multiple sugar transport system permease protein